MCVLFYNDFPLSVFFKLQYSTHVRPLPLTPCIHPTAIRTFYQKNIFIVQKCTENTCKSQRFSYFGLIVLYVSAEAHCHHQEKVTKQIFYVKYIVLFTRSNFF